MKNKKTFFLGFFVGVVATFCVLLAVSYATQSSNNYTPFNYLEKPVSYENKQETSFKVLQVLDHFALANEISNEEYDDYSGNTVVILGDDFYCDQVITIKNPQRVGTYNYTNNGGRSMTVPVIKQ